MGSVCVSVSSVASEGPSYLTSPAVTAAHAKELSAAGGKITAQDLAEAKPLERELLRVQVWLHRDTCTACRIVHVFVWLSRAQAAATVA